MPKIKMKPLGENVLIQILKADQKTNSGLYLPENAREEKSQEGKVTAVGESKDIKVKKGQKVIFRPYAGTEIKANGEIFLIVKNEDILAIVE